MHVLIAGCGYLGRRAASRWHHSGARVSVITRSQSKTAELSEAGFEPLIGDLAARELPALPEADVLLWSVGFDRTADVSREAIWIEGLEYLVQQLPDSVQRMMYVSSTGVYGQADGETVTESTDPQPVTESGRCCLRAEQLLQQWSSDGQLSASLTILRMAGLYGPGRLLRRTSDLQAGVPLPGRPDSWLNLIHIDDAVTAVVDLVPAADVGLLNVVNSGTLTREDYYRELARLTGAPDPVFDTTVAAARGGNKRVTSERRSSLGLTFQYDDVLAGLRHAVRS